MKWKTFQTNEAKIYDKKMRNEKEEKGGKKKSSKNQSESPDSDPGSLTFSLCCDFKAHLLYFFSFCFALNKNYIHRCCCRYTIK